MQQRGLPRYKLLMGNSRFLLGAAGIAILLPFLFLAIKAFVFLWPAIPMLVVGGYAAWLLKR